MTPDDVKKSPGKARLHHIGLVVEDIATAEQVFINLGFKPGNPPEPDPIQKVAASFMDLTGRGEVFLELLEPTQENSPISGHLAKGGGLHHLCFKVDDVEAACEGLTEAGFKPIGQPRDCIGLDRCFGRRPTRPSRIAFLLAPIRLLIELVEEG